MNTTAIYTSRKLEKQIKGFISENHSEENEYLGEWNATLFYVSHKKCWLFLNKLTNYRFIIPDVKKADVKNISNIFKENFHAQLAIDGINKDYKLIDKIIGDIALCETNNDRRQNGFINDCMFNINIWKEQFGSFENMPFRELNRRLNDVPIKLVKWGLPKDNMRKLLDTFILIEE